MNTNSSVAKPPYVPLKTFLNTINKLKEDGVPNRIDVSVFRGQSGSIIAALQSTYRFLSLVDDEKKPTAALHELVDAEENEMPAILKKIIQNSYSFLDASAIDMTRATSKQVETAFREQGINGSTITKAVGFYLAAANYSGLSYSSHIKVPIKPKGSGMARSSNSRKKSKNLPDSQTPADPFGNQSKTNAGGVKTPAELLLEKFPDFNPDWPDELKSKWFASFTTLQDAMLKGEK